jgi:hypothetical protein
LPGELGIYLSLAYRLLVVGVSEITQGPCLMLLAFYEMVLAAPDLRATLSYGIFDCSVRLSGVLEYPLSEAYLLSHSACFIDGSFR